MNIPISLLQELKLPQTKYDISEQLYRPIQQASNKN